MVLLQEVDSGAEPHEAAVLQLAGEILCKGRRDERAGIGGEEQLWISGGGERRMRGSIVATTSAGSPAIGISFGKRQVGRRDCGVGNGAR